MEATLKILGVSFVATGLLWFALPHIVHLKQVELEKLQIEENIERSQDAANSRQGKLRQEQEKSLQLGHELEKEKQSRSEAERQLENERRQNQENRARLNQAERNIIKEAPTARTIVKEIPKVIEKPVPVFVPRPASPAFAQVSRRPLLAAKPACSQWSYFRVGNRWYRNRLCQR